MTVKSTTFNTIVLSLISDGPVNDYMIAWKRNTSGRCSLVDMDAITIAAISSSSYVTITGLEEGSSYTITVTATNITANRVSVSATAITTEAGEVLKSMNEH